MSYIQSSQINIFPCSKARFHDRQSNLFYEQNISNIVRQVTDVDSYIISGEINSNCTVIEKLKLSLYGYYIEIEEDTQLVESNNNSDDELYVVISLTNTAKEGIEIPIPQELYGQDKDLENTGTQVFEPIQLLNKNAMEKLSNSETVIYHKLLLARCVNNIWSLVPESYVKLRAESIINLTEIDGLHPFIEGN